MSEEPIRVALAEDDVLLREGLASLLSGAGFEVVGQSGTADDLLAVVHAQHPQLVIVDIRMPPGQSTEGLDVAREIRSTYPDTAILILSAHVAVEPAMDLLAAGRSSGYLLKSRVTDVDEFLETVARIGRGDDRNVLRNSSQRRAIQMIEMGVREQNQIDRRKLLQ